MTEFLSQSKFGAKWKDEFEPGWKTFSVRTCVSSFSFFRLRDDVFDPRSGYTEDSSGQQFYHDLKFLVLMKNGNRIRSKRLKRY
jgi:hypothetical protein